MSLLCPQYLTSNEHIAFPFKEDAKGLADAPWEESPVKAFPTGFFVDAVVTSPTALSLRMTRIYKVLRFPPEPSEVRLGLEFRDENNNPYAIDITKSQCISSAYRQWITGYSNGVLFQFLVGSSAATFADYVTFVGLDTYLPLETSVVEAWLPRVTSITVKDGQYAPNYPVLSGSDGKPILFKEGYNVSIEPALLDVDEVPNGIPTLTEHESDMDTISISAVPGAGIGQVPCSEQPIDDGLLRSVSGAGGDEKGNLRIKTDGCYRIDPIASSPHTLYLYGDCAACCECDDYYAMLWRIRRLINNNADLVASGFDSELLVGLDGRYTAVSLDPDGCPVYQHVESPGIRLARNTLAQCPLDTPATYVRWEIQLDGSVVACSTATTSKVPIGEMWYMGEDADTYKYIDEAKSVHIGKYPHLGFPLSDEDYSIYPKTEDGTRTGALAGFVPYSSSVPPQGLVAIQELIAGLFDRNSESYNKAVDLWNSSDAAVAHESLVAWLSVGSATEDRAGSDRGVLNIRYSPATIQKLVMFYVDNRLYEDTGTDLVPYSPPMLFTEIKKDYYLGTISATGGLIAPTDGFPSTKAVQRLSLLKRDRPSVDVPASHYMVDIPEAPYAGQVRLSDESDTVATASELSPSPTGGYVQTISLSTLEIAEGVYAQELKLPMPVLYAGGGQLIVWSPSSTQKLSVGDTVYPYPYADISLSGVCQTIGSPGAPSSYIYDPYRSWVPGELAGRKIVQVRAGAAPTCKVFTITSNTETTIATTATNIDDLWEVDDIYMVAVDGGVAVHALDPSSTAYGWEDSELVGRLVQNLSSGVVTTITSNGPSWFISDAGYIGEYWDHGDTFRVLSTQARTFCSQYAHGYAAGALVGSSIVNNDNTERYLIIGNGLRTIIADIPESDSYWLNGSSATIEAQPFDRATAWRIRFGVCIGAITQQGSVVGTSLLVDGVACPLVSFVMPTESETGVIVYSTGLGTDVYLQHIPGEEPPGYYWSLSIDSGAIRYSGYAGSHFGTCVSLWEALYPSFPGVYDLIDLTEDDTKVVVAEVSV